MKEKKNINRGLITGIAIFAVLIMGVVSADLLWTPTGNLKVGVGDKLTSDLWNNTQNNIEYLSGELLLAKNSSAIEIYGDEDNNAKTVCNYWVSQNTPQGQDWIWVPARYFTTDLIGTPLTDSYYKRTFTYTDGKKYTCKGFAVAKYEMSYATTILSPANNAGGGDRNTIGGSDNPACAKVRGGTGIGCVASDFSSKNGGIVSKSGNYPIAEITQHEAIQACKSLGGNIHLITNNEYMAIARNIEAQSSNLLRDTTGSYIPNGISNDTRAGCAGNSGTTGNKRADKTGSAYCSAKRQLKLSNDAIIWDLAGNVREYVNKANTIDGSNYNSNSFRVSSACSNGNTWYSWSGNDGVVGCNFQNGYTLNIGPLNGANANNGVGRIYSYNTSSNIFLRGGNASAGLSTGVFTLNLGWAEPAQNPDWGARCVL